MADSCTGAQSPDLTWLLHRSAQRMRRHLDDVAAAHGLVDARDWIVLGEVAGGPPRTQLALAHELGLDKTTFTALVDRLEDGGLVRRTADCRDRRAKIPEVTARGHAVHAAVDADRRAAECTLLTTFTDREQALLRTLLSRLADDGCEPAASGCAPHREPGRPTRR